MDSFLNSKIKLDDINNNISCKYEYDKNGNVNKKISNGNIHIYENIYDDNLNLVKSIVNDIDYLPIKIITYDYEDNNLINVEQCFCHSTFKELSYYSYNKDNNIIDEQVFSIFMSSDKTKEINKQTSCFYQYQVIDNKSWLQTLINPAKGIF